jgi:hypothetical protein
VKNKKYKAKNMVELIKRLNYFDYSTRKSENVLTKEKAMKKKNFQLPQGSLNLHLLRILLSISKNKEFEYGKEKIEYCGLCNEYSDI